MTTPTSATRPLLKLTKSLFRSEISLKNSVLSELLPVPISSDNRESTARNFMKTVTVLYAIKISFKKHFFKSRYIKLFSTFPKSFNNVFKTLCKILLNFNKTFFLVLLKLFIKFTIM